jgi:uncharacterized repeat protein (TIGR01451 family)
MGVHSDSALRTRTLATLALLALIPRLTLAAPDLALAMSVDNPVPAPGQPVEFKVTLSNIGADPATGVVVTDKLPTELAIPTGLAAFPSTGTYDPATGAWSVGTMNAGSSATLVIPAIVVVPNPPPCSVNIAETSHSLDTRRANNRAVAAVRKAATDRCIDLKVTASNASFSDCGNSMQLHYSLTVTNAGPDVASNVYVDVSQSPAIAPNLRFTGTNCSGARCTITSLAAGAVNFLEAVSDSFKNNKDRAVTLGFAASSSDTDYSTADNQVSVNRALGALQKCPKYPGEGGFGAAGAGCFIATAAYGSPLEPHVMALRAFRDRYLQRSDLGRTVIRFYYRHSPPVAAVIARHEWLRFGARALLTPLVLAIAFPARACALLTLAFFCAWRLHARRAAH